MNHNLLSEQMSPTTEERLRILEEANRFTLDALEAAASLGDFQSSINSLLDTSVILEETKDRICRLIPFQATAFMLVDEETSEFVLQSATPSTLRTSITAEVEYLIETGTFSWALGTKSTVIVSTKDHKRKIALHAMATRSRTRGMFIGLCAPGTPTIPDVSLSLLSIILIYSSNAIESFELYSMIKQINENLEQTKNYRILFETAPDGLELIGKNGNILDCNREQEQLLGCNRNQIIGRHASHFLAEPSKTEFDQISRTLEEQGYVEKEMNMLHSDGKTIPVLKRAKALYDDGNQLIGHVVYNRNISSLREAERERKELQTRLQRAQKMEALGTLAGGVAHDLNNILVGLVSYPELIMMQLPKDSPLKKPVETIQKSGEKAAAIVQDLLTLARRGAAPREVVNINDIIADYRSSPEFESLVAQHPNVRIETRLESHLLNTEGSPVHLSKSISNLMTNAAESMPDGGTITITTENRHIDEPIRGYDTVEKGDYTVLSIADEGTGIAANDIDQIFEPFYSSKKMGKSGTGLGLAVVWGTTKDHNGYIDVESKRGAGTTFTLYLPATRQPSSRRKESLSIDSLRGNGERILVVDDIEEQREIAAKILGSLNYEILTAADGNEAIAVIRDTAVDLILLDMVMGPGPDGLETYRRILQFRPEQKAIIVSGYSETERVKQAQRLGVGGYVKKPYLVEALGMAIKKELASKTQRTT